MLARTQPSKSINHFTGATNTTKQQGIAGILRGFRQPGKGPPFDLFLFTSGPTEKDPFFFFSLSGSFIWRECVVPQLGTKSLKYILKLGQLFFLFLGGGGVYDPQQQTKHSLKSTSLQRLATVCLCSQQNQMQQNQQRNGVALCSWSL